MKFLVFIAPKDFKDESVGTMKMFFDRWGVQYHISSYSTKECVGTHGAIYKADINTNKVNTADYDGIILIDGKGIETYKLYEFRPLLDLILKFNNSKKYVMAVGNSIMVVAKANVIKEKKISMPQDAEAKKTIILFHGIPSDEQLEISGNIITMGGSGSLEEPIQTLLEHLGVK